MNYKSLILSSLLALGMSLGLSTAAQAKDTYFHAARHPGDHACQCHEHRHGFRHPYRHHGKHCDHQDYSWNRYDWRHLSRLNGDHHGRYRDDHHDSHTGYDSGHDRHERIGNREHRG